MDLVRYIPVSARRLFLRRRIFLVLCVLTLVVLGIFQSNLKTDREKIDREINIIHTAGLSDGARALDVVGVFRDDQRRLQSFVIVDDRKIHRKLEPGDVVKNKTRETKYKSRLNDIHRDKMNVDKERQNFPHIDDVFNINKIDKEKLQDKERQTLMEELHKLLTKLEKDGIDEVDLEKESMLNDDGQDDELNQFDPLQYPQQINFRKWIQTVGEKCDLPSNPINEWKYTAIINPSNKCEVENKNSIFLLFIVKTKPDNFSKRKVIRKTWADEKRFPNIRTVFSIGIPRDSRTMRSIKQESLEYKDVLLMDYMDTYHNLTLKTTSGINWAVAYCDVAKFVVSVDDDMYVATDFLLQHLKDMPRAKAERLFHGHLYHGTKPIRRGNKDDWQSKWIITKEEYPFSTYPDYIFGGFVIMSMRTVVEMSLVIPYTKPIDMEDVFLGIVASRLGIVATNTDLVDFYVTYSNTAKFKTLIASHYYSNTRMLKKAWECHLSIVEEDVEKSVFCIYLKNELEHLKTKINEILDWVDMSNDAI